MNNDIGIFDISEIIKEFDNSSKAWRENKKAINKGYFKYICGAINSKGKICKKINCKKAQHRNKYN